MIEIYSSLFTEQTQSAAFRADVGLGWAPSLSEHGRTSETRQTLAEVEIFIRDYYGLDAFHVYFARSWKYRAFVARARKSIHYWIKLLDSDFEEKQMAI